MLNLCLIHPRTPFGHS